MSNGDTSIDMNANSKEDPGNLNTCSNFGHAGNGGGVGAAADAADGHGSSGVDESAAAVPSSAPAPAPSTSATADLTNNQEQTTMANLEYLKSLAEVMSRQDDGNNNSSSAGSAASSFQQVNNFMSSAGGGGNGFQGDPSSGNGNGGGSNGNNNMSSKNPSGGTSSFVQIQNNGGSDTDTCASSAYPGRRVSRDSLASRDSLTDMLGGGVGADHVASNNMAMMSMLQQQQAQQMGGGNQNSMTWNFNNINNNNTNGQQQHQALNQSMSQLMMNGSMNMNHHSMSQQLKAGGMMNNAMGGGMGGWNNTNNSNQIGNAYGIMDNASSSTPPLLIPPKKTKNKHKQTFAQKLMHILSIKDCQAAMRWMPNGCAFCIVDSKELVERVLPKYFKEAKYTSFTRKLNRWGFKHFTLPTSEPCHEKEMSIYTHEKFLRDNPALCQQMDGGHRRRNSATSSSMTSGSGPSIQESLSQFGMGGNGMGGGVQGMSQQQQQLQQQQNMMMQQMQHQVQVQQQQQQMSGNQNQANQNSMNSMFDISNMGTGGGGSNNFNSMMFNNMNNGNNSNNNANSALGNVATTNLMGGADNGAVMGMRRTSLGFMPYLPTSNRRGSDFSMGGLSTVSNDMGSSFTNGAGGGGVAQHRGDSAQSIEKIMMGGGGNSAGINNATFDDYKVSRDGVANDGSQGLNVKGGGSGGDNGIVNQEDFQHSQAKLAVLEDMIAKERRKQSLLSSLDPDPVKMV